MTESTVEKITRNKFSTVLCCIFVAVLLGLIGKDFYTIFHNDSKPYMEKVLPGIQLIGSFITILWLALIMIVSSMTLTGPAFKKTCPYTVTFLIVLGLELVPRIYNDTGYWRWLWIVLAALAAILVLLQMLAFSLDPHSNSIFSKFRPFRIEVLTVIQMQNNQNRSVKKVAERSSIV